MAIRTRLQAEPDPPVFDVTAVTSNPEGVQLALVLAALDTLANRLSAANPDAILGPLRPISRTRCSTAGP